MTTAVEELSRRARALAPKERAELAEDLLASLEAEPQIGDDADVEVAWEREIKRRIEDIKAGTAKLTSAEDVYAETRRIYK